MKKLFLVLFVLLFISLTTARSIDAQASSVTLQVTDTGGQTWNNGTWSVLLVSQPGATNFGPPFNLTTGGSVSNQSQNGALNGTGGASLVVTQNSFVVPAQSQWKFVVCPAQGVPFQCFTQSVTIAGASPTVTLVPPAISVSCGSGVNAYADSEVNCGVGGQYYNLIAGYAKVCTAATGNTCTTWTGAGGVSGVTPNSTQFNNDIFFKSGRPWVDVVAYGADPTGVADSASAVQSAINAASSTSGGEVLIPFGTFTLSSAINMVANVRVSCAHRAILLFTAATNGIVWPSTAARSMLRGCILRASNPSSGKAIDIEDASSAAGNVVVEDVKIDALSAPTNLWAYGVFLSNALLERFSRVEFQSATVFIHTDGFSNSNDFDSINITGNTTSTTYVDIQGGSPITFLGGEIEGSASGELMKITQPTGAVTYVELHGTTLENANASGVGLRANGGRFESYGAHLSAVPASSGFVIGDGSTTSYCKVFSGSGSSWTLGANASFTTINGYIWSGAAPVDSSTGNNTIIDTRFTGDSSITSPSIPYGPVFNAGSNSAVSPQFKKGFTVDAGQVAQFGLLGYDIFEASSQLKFRRNSISQILLDNGTGDTIIRRLSGLNIETTLINGNFALSAGWGTTASISSLAGTDQRFTITVTSSGTGQAANPTITLTFSDGTWVVAPFAIMTMNGGSGVALQPTWTSTATTLTITYPGVPVSGSTYAFAVFVIG